MYLGACYGHFTLTSSQRLCADIHHIQVCQCRGPSMEAAYGQVCGAHFRVFVDDTRRGYYRSLSVCTGVLDILVEYSKRP
jgi:hypothetical protein